MFVVWTELITTLGPSFSGTGSHVPVAPGRLVKTQITGPTPKFMIWQGSKIWISNKSPGMLMLLVLGPQFENHCLGRLQRGRRTGPGLEGPQRNPDKWGTLSLYCLNFTFLEMTHCTFSWLHDPVHEVWEKYDIWWYMLWDNAPSISSIC